MPRTGKRLLAAVAGLVFAALCHAAPGGAGERDPHGWRETQDVARWILATGDHAGLPFAVVDKRGAHISVYEADGRLIGSSAALLGIDPGDFAVPGMAYRTPSSLTAGERTTPAGRFASRPGHNDKGEAIVWIDYDAALAIHRLRPAPAHQRRPQRLDSPTAEDNRVSLGCIVVPVDFYLSVIQPSLGQRRGVVYVLPESRPVPAMFTPVAQDH